MARDFARKFYSSRDWTQCREVYLKTQDYICERCGAPADVAHHKAYITTNNIHNPAITLNWDNLEALCATCHQHEHFKSFDVTREDVMFDINGELIESRTFTE